ncbi:hypothetical protein [Nostoc sp. TCL240-02]|uniref:hypothetical protein n=1 Tax=Nostoc sp. TCL240-02 TaxID=2572090 RepID=UPI0034A055C5
MFAIAAKEKPFPTAADFALGVQKVAPTAKRAAKSENPKTQLCNSVTVSQQSHPRYRDSGVIEALAPNHWQQIVTFSDGERLLINNADLDAASVPFPREQNYPPEYSSAITQIKEQHQEELERLEQELKIGLLTEASARAEAQVQEQIQSLQNLYKQQKEQNIQLQLRLSEMEGLRKLEIENQQLQQRIQELEHAVQQHPVQQWGNTMTQQATKALNKQVKQALEKTIDLRSLAVEPPKENAQECLRLMGMALKNLASAMNNTQALEAAAIILGSEPTPSAIAFRAEQLEMLPQAVTDIRQVLTKPGCTWQEFWAVGQEYEVIKSDYWAELSTEEIDLITALPKTSSQPDTIGIGSIVAHADPYRTLYVERGEVVEDLGEEVLVAWDCWKEQSKKAHAPLRGASPQIVQGVSEKEEDLPMAMDCTSLALVDAAQDESALLEGEKQDSGFELKDCYGGTCSAAPVAQNEKSSSSAITNQTQGQVEQDYSATLLVENSVSGGEVKVVDEGEISAAPVPNPEKGRMRRLLQGQICDQNGCRN